LVSLNRPSNPFKLAFLGVDLPLTLPHLSLFPLLKLSSLPVIEDRRRGRRNQLLSVLPGDVRERINEMNISRAIHVPVPLSVSIGVTYGYQRAHDEEDRQRAFHTPTVQTPSPPVIQKM
jgi:hypothetical protein